MLNLNHIEPQPRADQNHQQPDNHWLGPTSGAKAEGADRRKAQMKLIRPEDGDAFFSQRVAKQVQDIAQHQRYPERLGASNEIILLAAHVPGQQMHRQLLRPIGQGRPKNDANQAVHNGAVAEVFIDLLADKRQPLARRAARVINIGGQATNSHPTIKDTFHCQHAQRWLVVPQNQRWSGKVQKAIHGYRARQGNNHVRMTFQKGSPSSIDGQAALSGPQHGCCAAIVAADSAAVKPIQKQRA